MMDIPSENIPNYKLNIWHIQEYTIFINYYNASYSVGITTKLQPEYMIYIYMIVYYS